MALAEIDPVIDQNSQFALILDLLDDQVEFVVVQPFLDVIRRDAALSDSLSDWKNCASNFIKRKFFVNRR